MNEEKRPLTDEELDAVTGGTDLFYSCSEVQKGKYGEYVVITYYNDRKEATAHVNVPVDKVEPMKQRLNDRGMTILS